MGLLFNSTSEFLKAAARGDSVTVAKYLKSDAAGWLAARNKEGYSAMHVAAKNGQDGIIRQLLAAGAQVDGAARDGETPMTEAIVWNKLSTISLLLENGADPNIAGSHAPLVFAVARGHAEAVKLLLAAKADPNAGNIFITAMTYNRYDIAEQLVNAGAKTDGHDNYYRYPLHFAAMHGALDFVRLLISKDENINLNISDNNGHTPLHYAVMYGHKQVLDLLLEKGARADIENNQSQTPLAIARDRKQEAMVKALETVEKKSAPGPLVAVPLPAPALPAPALVSSDGENEAWVRMGDSRVAHVGTYPAVGRKLTEIFNFTSRERLIITENLRTGQENMTPPESFDTLAEEAVKKALSAFRALGGKADDEAVLNPRGVKKQLRQP